MKLSEVKEALTRIEEVQFRLEDGTRVPAHFHVTEVGIVTKNFIDCGGTIRNERKVNFQLWSADDYNHRLEPLKLLNIIALAEKALGTSGNDEVEAEYQNGTIGKYGIDFDGSSFVLTNTQTACLALDACGLPKPKINLSERNTNTCTPGSGCC